jgi:type I restriction enzyme S subunit
VSMSSRQSLADVAEYVTVGFVGPSSQHFCEDGVPFLRTGNVRRQDIILSNLKHVTPAFHARQRKSALKPEDVVVSRVISDEICAAVVPPELDGANCGNIIVIRPGKRLDARYLVHLISHPASQQELLGRQVGSAQAVVNTGVLKNWKIPLLPIEEQRRIAEILDRAEALRARRRAALAQLDTLTQSIFLDLFGSHRQTPVTIGEKLAPHPKGWRWELLTDVARLATGHTPDRERSDYWNGDIPWITLTEIRHFDGAAALHTAENITNAGIDHSSAVKLPAGTVCFSRTASVGFVTVMGREMATSQDFVNWVCGPRLDSMYLMHALLRSRARLRALSTGSTHKTIYFPTVEQFRVLLPPISLQREFAKRLGGLEKLKSSHLLSLVEFDELFASLQSLAFRGEL